MRRLILALSLLMLPLAATAQMSLWMAEEDGCMWCERWNAEIAEIYPKTEEGRAAPLNRFDVHEKPPAEVTFATRVHYTPTFVLVHNGTEVGRIEGYPGQDFFWPMLAELIARASKIDNVRG